MNRSFTVLAVAAAFMANVSANTCSYTPPQSTEEEKEEENKTTTTVTTVVDIKDFLCSDSSLTEDTSTYKDV